MWVCQCFNRDSCQNIHWLIFISFKYFLFILCLCNTKLCWGKGILFYYFHLFILASVHVFPYRIMKRKYKQWWSTIPTISTKQTTISYFKSLRKKDMTSRSWLRTGTKTVLYDEPQSTGTRPVKLCSGHIK